MWPRVTGRPRVCTCNASDSEDRGQGPGTVLGAGGTERQEVFLPRGLALDLEAFSDRALRRKVHLQKLPGTQLAPSIMQPPGREWGTHG